MSKLRKPLALLLTVAVLVSLLLTPVYAADAEIAAVDAAAEAAATAVTGSFENTSGDGGEDMIALDSARSFLAMIPVDMTLEEAEAVAETVTWSLLRDWSAGYLDEDLYPNQSEGGPLEDWLCNNDETPLFSNIVTAAVEQDGQVYLTVTFDNGIYFYSRGVVDASAPHSNGGTYMDVCGYFDLTAMVGEEVLGSTSLKIAPYDKFHTMAEIYDEIDSIVAFAAENTDLYVEEFSMGMSQGDNGLESLDMPYIIVARDAEAVANWLALTEEAETDPTGLIEKIESGALTDYQVPVMYSNIHSNEIAASDGILEFAWLLMEAAAGDGNIDYNTLTGFTEAGEAELAAQMGEAGVAGSVAVPDLVADSSTYLGYIQGEEGVSTVVDLDTYYTQETVTVNVDDLLDDVFFILVPEENVEGRTYLTRTSSGGFDLNRDNSFQTQAETQNMTQLIATWNPVSLTEFHGRVSAFQCEPCDPPHEPNFEYDLLAEHLMAGGEALGIGAVANNDAHNSYVIPQRDYLTYTGELTEDGEYETCWEDPWDDMSTSYTPQYAMLHGTVAYTVEVPAYDNDMVIALSYGQLNQSNYIAENKESYLLAQTRIFERGVTNANSDAYELVGQWFTDVYDVEGAEADLFRPEYDGEGQNGNFYPECYIIPLDGENQTNLQAANDMLEYLVRNDVKVMVAESAFTYDGVEYPAGTAVVSMYQAKRSVANGILYDGTVITEWPVLYSEGITAFNYTRGFDMIVCAEPVAYETIAAVCSEASWSVSSYFTGEAGADVIISNASEDSTAAVNALLNAGKTVGLITEGEYVGDFICSYEDWISVSSEYLISGTGVTELPTAYVISGAPTIYLPGAAGENSSGFVYSSLVSGSYEYNYDRQSMELMGFNVTSDPTEADIIVGAAALDDAALAEIKNGTPYIGYGRRVISAASSLFEDGALTRETVSSSSMDALGYVTYPTESLITASYVSDGDDVLYGYGAGYFATIPEGAEILVQMDGSRELLEGFLNSDGEHYEDFLNDSIQAIAYEGADKDGNQINICLFANTLTNKVHQRDEFAFISNFIFSNMTSNVLYGLEALSFEDVAVDAWYYAAIQYCYNNGQMVGITDTTFEPQTELTRAMMATILWRLAGEPEAETVEFTDCVEGAWYEDAISWAASTGVAAGYGDGTFGPSDAVTREQLVTMIYRLSGLLGVDVSAEADLSSFVDAATVSTWAEDAVEWAVAEGIVTGTTATTLSPAASTTRAQAATLIFRCY